MWQLSFRFSFAVQQHKKEAKTTNRSFYANTQNTIVQEAQGKRNGKVETEISAQNNTVPFNIIREQFVLLQFIICPKARMILLVVIESLIIQGRNHRKAFTHIIQILCKLFRSQRRVRPTPDSRVTHTQL